MGGIGCLEQGCAYFSSEAPHACFPGLLLLIGQQYCITRGIGCLGVKAVLGRRGGDGSKVFIKAGNTLGVSLLWLHHLAGMSEWSLSELLLCFPPVCPLALSQQTHGW